MIIRSAYLELSHHRMMAQIIFSDGSKSQMLATKRQALEIGEGVLGIKMDEHEWLAVKEQIHSSPLIPKNKGMEEFCSQMQNNLDELRRKLEAFFKEEERRDGEGEEWKKS